MAKTRRKRRLGGDAGSYGYLRPACLALNDLGHRLRKSSFNGVGIMRGASALHQQQIPHCCGAIP
jgi:hypothetical protein